jgi:hypothetical protein
MATELKRMQSIRGSTADWAANDIVLLDGEIGVETRADGSMAIKIGDGVTVWSLLPTFGNPTGTSEGNTLIWNNTSTEWQETDIISVNTSGQIVNRSPTAPSYLMVEGDNADYTWVMQVQSGDLRFYDFFQTSDRAVIKGDGSYTIGYANTYAGQGAGTLDVATAIYINGEAVPTRTEFDDLEARVTALETP